MSVRLVPSWLDPALELTDNADLEATPDAWARTQLATLAGLGLDPGRAVELVAHCATECAWGRRAIGHNLGGVKITERVARAATAEGRPLAWLRAPGHVASGDSEVCFYRAWESDEAFWRFWVSRYVPRPGAHVGGSRYAATGAAFWSDAPARWFVELLLAGYRGEVRQREIARLLTEHRDTALHPSVAEHLALVERVRGLANG